MACRSNRLVMKIKSGEARGFTFTIKTNTGLIQDGQPVYRVVDLTDYTVSFQIKKYPYFTVDPIIDKEITSLQDGTKGWILDQSGDDKGKFIVQITMDDMSRLIPEKDYYLILTLQTGDQRIIISGEGDTSGIFRVCQS